MGAATVARRLPRPDGMRLPSMVLLALSALLMFTTCDASSPSAGAPADGESSGSGGATGTGGAGGELGGGGGGDGGAGGSGLVCEGAQPPPGSSCGGCSPCVLGGACVSNTGLTGTMFSVCQGAPGTVGTCECGAVLDDRCTGAASCVCPMHEGHGLCLLSTEKQRLCTGADRDNFVCP